MSTCKPILVIPVSRILNEVIRGITRTAHNLAGRILVNLLLKNEQLFTGLEVLTHLLGACRSSCEAVA